MDTATAEASLRRAPVPAAPDFAAIKRRQQATWASGDYAVVGSTLQIVGEELAEAANVRAGEWVLDVAAGNGNATLAAARRFARVTSTDYVQHLLDKGAARAKAERLEIKFLAADVEDLPFPDGEFDVVLSTFGAMFAPDHARTAREMLRVARGNGRIGLASWTPEGFIGQLFRVIGKYVPAPAGVNAPALWGNEAYVATLFGAAGNDIRAERKYFNFRYHSAAHWLRVFREFYGPTHKAFAALDAIGQEQLAADITALLERLNVGGRHSLVVPSEYLEVVITKTW
jgi:SAM-dependent methyltransferase